MKQSLSYYLVLFVLKLKGLKKDFSEDPIDFKKIRKEDVHHPKGTFLEKYKVRNFEILNTSITEVSGINRTDAIQNETSNKLLILIHGGAFISGPAQHHWDTLEEIVKHTNHHVWMCDYPKAPENGILEISQNIDAVYKQALETYQAKHITLIGDSVGGTLITALTQRLVEKNSELPLKIILISPVMDATLTNPEIDEIDKIDPMLSKAGVLSAKKMCAKGHDLTDPMISPINGSFDNFPDTNIYLATNDITYPDQQLAIQQLIKAKTNIEIIEGENMPHIWPLLPIMKEAKTALKDIINRLNQ